MADENELPVEENKYVSMLKEGGLDLAEDSAKIALETAFALIEQAAKASENKFDDALLGMLPMLKPVVLEYIDMIDGKKG